MINKKLDEIKVSLSVVEELMQDNKYLENLDKCLEKEKKINIELQERINKAIEYIKTTKVIDECNVLQQITNYEKNILEILEIEKENK